MKSIRQLALPWFVEQLSVPSKPVLIIPFMQTQSKKPAQSRNETALENVVLSETASTAAGFGGWAKYHSVTNGVRLGPASSQSDCLEMCRQHSSSHAKYACAYQCNGCYLGTSTVYETQRHCWVHATTLSQCSGLGCLPGIYNPSSSEDTVAKKWTSVDTHMCEQIWAGANNGDISQQHKMLNRWYDVINGNYYGTRYGIQLIQDSREDTTVWLCGCWESLCEGLPQKDKPTKCATTRVVTGCKFRHASGETTAWSTSCTGAYAEVIFM